MNIVKGDVRKLQFENASFDGYWSLGVIEHFYDGYESILEEMSRILRPGGYIFCTFPAMNEYRKKRARKGVYQPWQQDDEVVKDFYQFALDPEKVETDFRRSGFRLVETQGIGTLTGWGEENDSVRWSTDVLSRFPFGLVPKVTVLIDPVLGKKLGHMVLLVMQKTM